MKKIFCNSTLSGGFVAYIMFGVGIIAIGGVAFLMQKNAQPVVVDFSQNDSLVVSDIVSEEIDFSIEAEEDNTTEIQEKPSLPTVSHVPTPEHVRAIYMSSWVAATPSFRSRLVQLIESTELNSVVIDIKDDTGRVSFMPFDPYLIELGVSDNRVRDMQDFLQSLHDKGIYTIGRISVFQDPFIVKKKPEWAVQSKQGGIWKDRKGLAFLSVDNKDVWDYILRIAIDSHAIGFDEINFDYIRYPSDGIISDIEYNLGVGESRAEKLEEFFIFLDQELRQNRNIFISADLFGMVTSNTDDLGIGQVLERAVPYFDVIAPMVYPSHYPTGFLGYAKPAEHPYEVILYAMQFAHKRVSAMGYDPEKVLRPWLQDFNLGAIYTKEKIQAQINGNKDAGLSSWMIWDPSNKYNATKRFLGYGI